MSVRLAGGAGAGRPVPLVGLGTWQASTEEIQSAVSKALGIGYRHFDTAFNYNNEEAIGKVIKQWLNDGKGTREDLFITTKLPHIANRAQDVRQFLELQLKRLQLEYVDLYLIHVPFGFYCDHSTLTPKVKEDGEYELDMDTDHISTWKALEECHKDGLVKNLGLSNFNEQQIEKIIQSAEIQPVVLQVEVHGNFQQIELRRFCALNNIIVTAYAPLGSPGAKEHFVTKYKYRPDAFPDLLGHSEVIEIAKAHNKTSAQVLLRFLVQQNVVVIPKSVSELRLKENIDLFDFELSQSDMEKLRNLDKRESGRIFNFLFWKGVEKHPEYPFKEVLQHLQ